MGFIRNTIVAVFSSLFFISLLFMNVFFTFNLSSDYDNINENRENIYNSFFSTFSFIQFDNSYDLMKNNCRENNNYFFYIDFIEDSILIPCEDIKDYSKTKDYFEKEVLRKIYYKDYNCTFIECMQNQPNPLLFATKISNDYWNQKFLLMVFVSLIILIFILILIKKKSSIFFISGISLILSSIPFNNLNWLSKLLLKNRFGEFFVITFSKSQEVFLITFSIGIILVIVGLLFKIFNLGFKISQKILEITTKYQEEKQKKEIENKFKILKKEQENKKLNSLNKVKKVKNKKILK